MMRRLLPYLQDHKGGFALAALLAMFTVLTGAGLMSTSGHLITRAAERPLITDLFMVTAMVRFFGISRAAVRYAERVVAHNLTFRILLTMRTMLFRTLESQPLKVFMSRRPGELLAAIHHHIDTLQHVYLRIITPVVAAILFCVITTVILTFVNPVLAWATFSLLVLHGVTVPALAMRLARGRGRTEVRTKANLTTWMTDQLQGLHETKWMGTSAKTVEQYDALQRTLDNEQRHNSGDAGLLEGLNTLIPLLSMLTILALSIPWVMGGMLNPIVLAAITFGVLASFEAVQSLGNAFLQWEGYAEASAGIAKITGSHEPSTTEAPQPLPLTLQTFSFQNVNFSYIEEHITLKNISFTLKPGQRTAIVGASGCGKSTVANLLLAFYQPDNGGITYGEHPIHSYPTEEYRGLFGVVSQDSHVFNRTIRENLLIAKPDASDDVLRQSLDRAGIGRLANHLDLEPGNLGMQLSGGERQRLLLARALLRDTPVWVFDEATAHLDITTERNILETIFQLSKNRTLLMITHRLVNMEKMDQILVMDKGTITETGTHSSLMQANGTYAALYSRQMEVITTTPDM